MSGSESTLTPTKKSNKARTERHFLWIFNIRILIFNLHYLIPKAQSRFSGLSVTNNFNKYFCWLNIPLF
ncbi:unnamed protein product [Allacma fusca]|uniref:Uncharacterized protein n=1 Tax=Allacma fusca TaxID=39272 RepID=A0A8J2KLX3_9HEXA|nr:unnamed protein product [Allacma fusca]